MIQTPRSGRVFTQRVALHLPPAGAGWLATPTPRAAANPRLNAWLAKQLPAAGPHRFRGPGRGGGQRETTTLDAIGLEPIDLVLMSGDRFGDGTQRARTLSRGPLALGALDRRRRRDHTIPAIRPRPGIPAGYRPERGVGRHPCRRVSLPQLRALRRLIGASARPQRAGLSAGRGRRQGGSRQSQVLQARG